MLLLLNVLIFAAVNAVTKHSTLMNELNWNEIVSNIQDFPFRISEIHTLNKNIKLSKVSFKYNIEGKETYYNGSKEAVLKTGEYLIATNQEYCEVKIAEDKKDLGVCVDINMEYLLQGIQAFLQPNKFVNEHDKLGYFVEDNFFIKHKSNREFHRYMQALFVMVKNNSFDSLQEMEYEFIRQFLFHQTPFLVAYKQVPAIKRSTRNELYTKMVEAKNILQDSIYTHISIKELATMLFLSEYRFFHLFKETFQITPHKYLLQLKMNEAILLYRKNSSSWTEIANRLEFADVQSFSKIFKKHFRMSPSEYGKFDVRGSMSDVRKIDFG